MTPIPQPSAETAATFDPSSLVDSLDDAVNKLRQASELNGGEMGGTGWVRWVSVVAGAQDQREAAEKLAVAISSASAANVRVGWGGKNLNRLFDSRLGWLGAESGLYHDAAAVWDESQSLEGFQHFTLSHPGSAQQAVFWIHQQASSTVIRDFSEHCDTMAELIWSRPSPWISRVMGPITGSTSHRRSRGIMIGIVAISIGMLLLPVSYPVDCHVVVETTQARYVATPFEATLLRADVRIGDRVSEGQTLFTLDGRPMRIERQGLLAERQEASKQYDSALASRRIAESQQAKLKRDQIDRKLELLTDRLGQLEVKSPIEGVVISGDLQKRIGSPMERGEAMMEIAAMNPLRLELEIPDHDIQMVDTGDLMTARLDALGNQTFQATVDRIRPVAEIREDNNIFIATVPIDNADGTIRPGMQGEAVIDGPVRPWIWSYVRDVFEKTLWTLGF